MKTFIQCILIATSILSGCGKGAKQSDAITSKDSNNDLISEAKNKPKVVPKRILKSTFRFKETESNSSCQGISIGQQIFITPAHCFESRTPQKKYSLKIEEAIVDADIKGLIPKSNDDVEDILLLQINPGFSFENTFKIESFPLPAGIYPPFNMPIGLEKGFCSAATYHATGLVAYNCPTDGAMSGALLFTPDGLPFAIHLGRKASLGYGLVLGSIKGDLRRKMAEIDNLSLESTP